MNKVVTVIQTENKKNKVNNIILSYMPSFLLL